MHFIIEKKFFFEDVLNYRSRQMIGCYNRVFCIISIHFKIVMLKLWKKARGRRRRRTERERGRERGRERQGESQREGKRQTDRQRETGWGRERNLRRIHRHRYTENDTCVQINAHI